MKRKMLIAGFHNQLQLHTKIDLKNSRFKLSSQRRIPAGEWLDDIPPFSIKEIEQQTERSGKTPEKEIMKTLYKGENVNVSVIYLLILYTQSGTMNNYVKCKASMKKEKKRVSVK